MTEHKKHCHDSGDPEEKLIIIVDDDESVWDMLNYVVQKEGFIVEKASDGQEAIDKTRLLRPALILLDLMLPKCGGFEVLRELQDGDTADIPVVLVSGRCMDRSTLEMIKREPNVKDFIEKPVKPQILAALLHTLLKTKPVRKEPGNPC